ncbi:hypothetical protein OAO10_00590 [Luminiphilus sp.]|nr:hypothetical protein [Luminiphilus sp.]
MSEGVGYPVSQMMAAPICNSFVHLTATDDSPRGHGRYRLYLPYRDTLLVRN